MSISQIKEQPSPSQVQGVVLRAANTIERSHLKIKGLITMSLLMLMLFLSACGAPIKYNGQTFYKHDLASMSWGRAVPGAIERQLLYLQAASFDGHVDVAGPVQVFDEYNNSFVVGFQSMTSFTGSSTKGYGYDLPRETHFGFVIAPGREAEEASKGTKVDIIYTQSHLRRNSRPVTLEPDLEFVKQRFLYKGEEMTLHLRRVDGGWLLEIPKGQRQTEVARLVKLLLELSSGCTENNNSNCLMLLPPEEEINAILDEDMGVSTLSFAHATDLLSKHVKHGSKGAIPVVFIGEDGKPRLKLVSVDHDNQIVIESNSR